MPHQTDEELRLAAAQRAVAAAPHDLPSRTTLVRALHRLDAAEAAAVLEAAEKAPFDVDLRIEQGRVYGDRDDHLRALGCFDNALKLLPIYNAALIAKSESLRSLRRYAEVEAILRKALERFPLLESLRFELGWLCRDRQRLAEADRFFTRLRDDAVNPRDRADALNGLGWVRITNEDYAIAVQHFRQAVRADPLTHDNRLGLAWALTHQDTRAGRQGPNDTVSISMYWSASHVITSRIPVSASCTTERTNPLPPRLISGAPSNWTPPDGSYVELAALLTRLGRLDEAG